MCSRSSCIILYYSGCCVCVKIHVVSALDVSYKLGVMGLTFECTCHRQTGLPYGPIVTEVDRVAEMPVAGYH